MEKPAFSIGNVAAGRPTDEEKGILATLAARYNGKPQGRNMSALLMYCVRFTFENDKVNDNPAPTPAPVDAPKQEPKKAKTDWF